MIKDQTRIRKRLEIFAFERSKPYCESCDSYPEMELCESCFKVASTRELPGMGKGPLSWVIGELLMEARFDPEGTFNGILDGGKELFFIGYFGITASGMLRAAFPQCYNMLLKEFKISMAKRGRIMKISSRLYWKDDVLDLLNMNNIL